MNTINFRERTVAFPLQQWLHECSTMVRYTYVADIVIGYIRTLNFTYTDFCMWPFSYVAWSVEKLLIYYVIVFLIDFDKESFALNVSIIKLQETSCIYKIFNSFWLPGSYRPGINIRWLSLLCNLLSFQSSVRYNRVKWTKQYFYKPTSDPWKRPKIDAYTR